MNSVQLIGNISKDPEFRVAPSSQMGVAHFSIAIGRGKDKDGNDKGVDFPNIVAFGKTAEVVERYAKKGDKIAIIGRIQTGSYEKDGKKIYTTEVVADRVELLGGSKSEVKEEKSDIPEGFAELDPSDIPF